MAKENTFLKNIGGISNAINSVTEVIADRRAGESSKMADVGGAEGHSVKIIDTVDNIIEPVSHKIKEYSANLSRIAERYAIN